MITKPRLVAVSAIAMLTVGVLAGCSSENTETTTPDVAVSQTPTTEPTDSTASTDTPASGDASAPADSTAPADNGDLTGPSVEPAPSDAATDGSAPAEPMVGGDPGTWAPVELKPETTNLDLVVNQGGFFSTLPEGAVIESSDPAIVLAVSPTAESLGGVTAVAVGTATITVKDASGAVLAEIPVVVAEVPEVVEGETPTEAPASEPAE